MLIGEKENLVSLLERPGQTPLGVARGAYRAVVLSGEGLDGGTGVHVGDGNGSVGNPRSLEGSPAVLDLTDFRHVCHGAASRHVRKDDFLVIAGQNVGALCHEMHAAENNELRLWSCGGLLGELERIPGDIGELNDLVTLIVMAQDEEPFAEFLLGCQGTRDKIGVGRRG